MGYLAYPPSLTEQLFKVAHHPPLLIAYFPQPLDQLAYYASVATDRTGLRAGSSRAGTENGQG